MTQRQLMLTQANVMDLFESPLDVIDPKLPGELQKLDVNTIKRRAGQLLDDYRTVFLIQFLLLLNCAAMLTNPHTTDEGVWETISDVIMLLALVEGVIEIVVYAFAHGVLPNRVRTKSSVNRSRLSAVLLVWSPPRFRQELDSSSKSHSLTKGITERPLLGNNLLCFEAVLLVISIAGYFVPSWHALSRLRYFHGIRAIRLCAPFAHVIPTVHVTIASFRYSITMLFSAGAFLLFFFVVFGVFGVDQFKGSLSFRCVMINPNVELNISSDRKDEICLNQGRLMDQCVETLPPLPCAKSSERSFFSPIICHYPKVCRYLDPPNYGYTNFDHLLFAWLTMLQISSLSDWAEISYGLWAASPRVVVELYFVVLIVLISFVVLNFLVAILTSSYGKARAKLQSASYLFRRSRTGGQSLIMFLLEQLIWWRFSATIVHHLTYEVEGSEKRRPFYKHIRWVAASGLLLAAVVLLHAANGTHMPSEYKDGLRIIEICYCCIFVLEIFFSVLSCGSLGLYMSSDFNKFEAFSFLLTVVGVSIALPLSVLRALKVIRIFRYISFVRKTNLLRHTMLSFWPSIIVTAFLLLCCVVMAAVAIQLFSTDPDVFPPEENFNTIPVAILLIFRIVTLDAWEQSTYEGIRLQHWLLSLLFFIPAYILLGYTISSLFTGVIIESFDPHSKEKQEKQESAADGAFTDDGEFFSAKMLVKHKEEEENEARPFGEEVVEEETEAIQFTKEKEIVKDKSFACFGVNNKLRKVLIRLVVAPGEVPPPSPEAKASMPRLYGHFFQFLIIFFILLSCIQVAFLPPQEACSQREDESMTDLAKKLHLAADIIFAIIFTVEMLIKMVAHGVLFPGDDRPWYIGPVYLRDIWNVLDFVLLVGMYVSFLYPEAKAFRLFRTLRPLRVVRRVERMRVLVNGVVSALPSIILFIIYGIFLIFIFAIIGVGLFEGKLNYCTTDTIGGVEIADAEECSGIHFNELGILTHARWTRRISHFDHVGAAMGYLVEVASLSHWTDLMSHCLDIVGKDQQPLHHNSLHYSSFFFVYVILLVFFVANVIVGIIIRSLDKQRGLLFLTSQQRTWFLIRKEMLALKPYPPPKLTFFPRIQQLVSHRLFKLLINIAIFLNILTIASVHYNQDQYWTDIQFYSNIVFLGVFIIEMLLKMMAFGKYYFRDGWNVLDFVIVMGSCFELIYSLSTDSGSKDFAITSVGRTFRILRIFRSVKRIPSLRGLFHTLVDSLSAIISITAFLLILLFMYAVIAMSVFAHIRFQQTYNFHANFRTIDGAAMTLFRMVTLDGWNFLMNDLRSYVKPYCNFDQEGLWYLDVDTNDGEKQCGMLNDCSSELSLIYFLSFFGFGSFVFLNIVIAIMLDSFKYISTQARTRIKVEHLDSFRTAWLRARRTLGAEFNYEKFIECQLLGQFVIDLFNDDNTLVRNEKEGLNIHPVLTASSRMNFKKLKYELACMAEAQDLPAEEAYTFHNILFACARMQMGMDALTHKQRKERNRFESERSMELVGQRIRTEFSRAVIEMRQRREEMSSTPASITTAESPQHPLVAMDSFSSVAYEIWRGTSFRNRSTSSRGTVLEDAEKEERAIKQESFFSFLNIFSYSLEGRIKILAHEIEMWWLIHLEMTESEELACRFSINQAEDLAFSTLQSRVRIATWAFQEPIPPRNPLLSEFLPLCGADLSCTLYGDPQHCTARRHTCRNFECMDVSEDHLRMFVHTDEWVLEMEEEMEMEEELVMTDED